MFGDWLSIQISSSLPNQDSKRHPQSYWVWRPASGFLTSIIIYLHFLSPLINLKLDSKKEETTK
jgi:hypothetical protein